MRRRHSCACWCVAGAFGGQRWRVCACGGRGPRGSLHGAVCWHAGCMTRPCVLHHSLSARAASDAPGKSLHASVCTKLDVPIQTYTQTRRERRATLPAHLLARALKRRYQRPLTALSPEGTFGWCLFRRGRPVAGLMRDWQAVGLALGGLTGSLVEQVIALQDSRAPKHRAWRVYAACGQPGPVKSCSLPSLAGGGNTLPVRLHEPPVACSATVSPMRSAV